MDIVSYAAASKANKQAQKASEKLSSKIGNVWKSTQIRTYYGESESVKTSNDCKITTGQTFISPDRRTIISKASPMSSYGGLPSISFDGGLSFEKINDLLLRFGFSTMVVEMSDVRPAFIGSEHVVIAGRDNVAVIDCKRHRPVSCSKYLGEVAWNPTRPSEPYFPIACANQNIVLFPALAKPYIYSNPSLGCRAESVSNVLVSKDYGISWKIVALPRTVQCSRAVYLNNVILIPPVKYTDIMTISLSGTATRERFENSMSDVILYSKDGGETWQESILPFTCLWDNLTYGNDKYVIMSVGWGYPTTPEDPVPWVCVVYSKDLLSWQSTKVQDTLANRKSGGYYIRHAPYHVEQGRWIFSFYEESGAVKNTDNFYDAGSDYFFASFDNLETIDKTKAVRYTIPGEKGTIVFCPPLNPDFLFDNRMKGASNRKYYSSSEVTKFWMNSDFISNSKDSKRFWGLCLTSNKIAFEAFSAYNNILGNNINFEHFLPINGTGEKVLPIHTALQSDENHQFLSVFPISYKNQCLWKDYANNCMENPLTYYLFSGDGGYQWEKKELPWNRQTGRFYKHKNIYVLFPHCNEEMMNIANKAGFDGTGMYGLTNEILVSTDYGMTWEIEEVSGSNNFNGLAIIENSMIISSRDDFPAKSTISTSLSAEVLPMIPASKIEPTPHTIGFYLGNGEENRRVSIGFQPKMVLVQKEGDVVPMTVSVNGFFAGNCNEVGVHYQYLAFEF